MPLFLCFLSLSSTPSEFFSPSREKKKINGGFLSFAERERERLSLLRGEDMRSQRDIGRNCVPWGQGFSCL
jgi:hypothetical protein